MSVRRGARGDGATTTNGPEPILAGWKVSEVLGRHPELLEVLVGLSPVFRPLRNPIRRRVRARLVTVAQAARIAGLEPAALVRALNTAVGTPVPGEVPGETPGASTAAPIAVPSWLERAPVAVELDVRPLLERGEEPFGAISREAARVPVGEVLRLRAPFEPLPLYDALAKRGFVGWARQRGPGDWEVSFLNEGWARERPPAPPPPAAPARDAPSATVTIDVSELVPPEPMVKILEALERLPPGGTLLVHHVRRPIHLYPRLDELGCRHETRELGPGRIELLIRKPAPSGEAG